jgi:hypothetical protein
MFMELISHLLGPFRAGEFSGIDAFMHHARAWLLTKAASEAQCEKSLQGDVYTENYGATRFMLCELEEAHQTVETRRDLWAHDASERPVFTLEHILPKTENLGPAWMAMLEAPGKGSADDVRRRYAHQLGNLTLSGYNANPPAAFRLLVDMLGG